MNLFKMLGLEGGKGKGKMHGEQAKASEELYKGLENGQSVQPGSSDSSVLTEFGNQIDPRTPEQITLDYNNQNRILGNN